MKDLSQYSPGALVRIRERDWVVIPQEEDSVIRLRPVDGTEHDAIGIFLPLEKDTIGLSEYPTPKPNNAGDFTGELSLV